MKYHIMGAVSRPMMCASSTHQTREYPGQIVQTRWSRVMAAMAMSFS